jgi:hypothetical protein
VPRLICGLLPAAPTDGDPAIIGSIWLHSDVPDGRFMELIVCKVAHDDAVLLRVVVEPFELDVAFRFTTH